MKFLRNKKAFSLVELMIVVVIMGILIAVAIPLYNAVTENAEANTCGSNQRLVRGAFANWVVMEDTNDATTLFKTGYTSFNGKTDNPADVFVEDFYERFSSDGFPKCPGEGCYYTIEPDGSTNIKMYCHHEDGTVNDKHESKE